MAPKSSNDNSAYKSKIKLDLEKLKNNQIQNVKVDLTKIDIQTLATLLGVLSEDVKLYMKLLTANRYYALNDRTINFLSQGEVDMSATTGVAFGFASLAAADNVSDAEVEEVLDIETEVEFPKRDVSLKIYIFTPIRYFSSSIILRTMIRCI